MATAKKIQVIFFGKKTNNIIESPTHLLLKSSNELKSLNFTPWLSFEVAFSGFETSWTIEDTVVDVVVVDAVVKPAEEDIGEEGLGEVAATAEDVVVVLAVTDWETEVGTY